MLDAVKESHGFLMSRARCLFYHNCLIETNLNVDCFFVILFVYMSDEFRERIEALEIKIRKFADYL